MALPSWAAVVLAGGAARRLGGADKPLLAVSGTPMLTRVLDAVTDARQRIVVGPPALRTAVPPDVLVVQEQPPGGGPVAAIAAGLTLVEADLRLVAVLGGDMPFLTPEPVTLLRLTAWRARAQVRPSTPDAGGAVDGAVFVDGDRRRQLLCGVWHVAALRARLAEAGQPHGLALRKLLDTLRVSEVTWPAVATPPWFDCDTEDDLRRAREHG